MGNEFLLQEITKNAKVIPLECQERVLEVLKAMAFTRKITGEQVSVTKDDGEEG